VRLPDASHSASRKSRVAPYASLRWRVAGLAGCSSKAAAEKLSSSLACTTPAGRRAPGFRREPLRWRARAAQHGDTVHRNAAGSNAAAPAVEGRLQDAAGDAPLGPSCRLRCSKAVTPSPSPSSALRPCVRTDASTGGAGGWP
jgi:hypothetical protein